MPFSPDTISADVYRLMHGFKLIRVELGNLRFLQVKWTLSHVYYKAVPANIYEFLCGFPKTKKPSESQKHSKTPREVSGLNYSESLNLLLVELNMIMSTRYLQWN